MVSARLSLTLMLCAAVRGEDAPDFADVADEEACEMQQTLLQVQTLKSRASRHLANQNQTRRPLCVVNQHIMCADGSNRMCSGDQCCPDGSTCPSASVHHVSGCAEPKLLDCTNQQVEDCSGGGAQRVEIELGKSRRSAIKCVTASVPVTCASNAGDTGQKLNTRRADDTFEITTNGREVCARRTDRAKGWGQKLKIACATIPEVVDVLCPDGSGIMCAGNQCCPGGSTCPSAEYHHVRGCPAPKMHDCTAPSVSLLQNTEEASQRRRQVEPKFRCAVEEHLTCPDGSGRKCSGDQCCPDGSTCPSASVHHVEGCAAPKTHDCTTALAPGVCEIGEHLMCPDGSGRMCSGNQCCPDGSTCPSARYNHVHGCEAPKKNDCTGVSLLALTQKASVGNRFLCDVEEHTTCPDGSGRKCSGDQCCPDGSTCPSASVNHVEGCAKEKKHDCTTHQVPNFCEVADHLTCPDGSGIKCSGDQCCPGGSTCPSASVDHVEGCAAPKMHDCTAASLLEASRRRRAAVPAEVESCAVGAHLECPDGSGRWCSGDQCCPDGSTCPSASVHHVDGCSKPRQYDCTATPPPADFLCALNEHLECPDGSGRMCSGDQCCPDGSTCPSASVHHVEGCQKPRKFDCTRAR